MMHPIEHLRHVARAGGDPALVAREAALALAEIAGSDPAGLVPGCRRLIERHLLSGPLWWLSARVLSAEDQAAAARQAAAELASDPTDRHVAASVPDEATVLVLGWPEITASALRRRGDVEALVVDSAGEGAALVRRLGAAGGEATLVPESGVGPATATSDLVVVEALAAGPTGVLAAPASLAAAAVASHSSVPVWAVTGVGRV
ncbi:MAG: hypothetical protein ACRDWW_06680, partial [Acidimicrobiales bacterium]